MNRRELSKLLVLIIILFLSVMRYFSFVDPFTELLTKITNPISSNIYQQIVTGSQVISPQSLEEHNDSSEGSFEVLKRELTPTKKEIIVRNDGTLKTGDALTSENWLIGVVVATTDQWSRIRLITDPNFRAAATTDESIGIIKNHQGSLLYDIVDNPDLTDQLVFTSGLNGVFKPGVAIGKIGERVDSEQTSFASYSLELSVNPLEIQDVRLVR